MPLYLYKLDMPRGMEIEVTAMDPTAALAMLHDSIGEEIVVKSVHLSEVKVISGYMKTIWHRVG